MSDVLEKGQKVINHSISRSKQPKQVVARPRPILTSGPLDLITKTDYSSYQQSKFFTLPAELRIIIYDYVFGFSDIHLLNFRIPKDPLEGGLFNVYDHRLESFPCWDPFAMARYGMCACVKELGWVENKDRDVLEACLKNMMLTCRAFYHEIVAIMFRYCTFQIDDLNTVILASLARPQRFNSIFSLHLNAQVLRASTRFSAALPNFPRSVDKHFSHLPPRSSSPSKEKRLKIFRKSQRPGIWDAACDAISNMTSLRRLKIQLCRDVFGEILSAKCPDVPTYNEAFVFKPLQRIERKRDLEVFEVEVDWTEEKEGWITQRKEELGFVLTRREYFGTNHFRMWM